MPRRQRLRDRTILVSGEAVSGAQPYRIVSHLGHGAFSEVYVAALPDGQQVALKEVSLHCPFAEQEERRRLVQSEAGMLRLIAGHPLMLGLYETFESDAYLYTAVTLIEGLPLSAVLAEARDNHNLLAEWGCKLARAVAWLHAKNIVHHDLKPENILLDAHGDPIIVDYGAAARADAPDQTLYGSDGYLPPEVRVRILRGDVGARLSTDVFALGILLYQMLLGRSPSQEDINALSGRIAGPLLRKLESMNPALARTIVRAMSFAEEFRYPDASALVADLSTLTRPIARADRYALSFGEVPAEGLSEQRVQIVNVGGGNLEGEVTTEEPWLELQVGGGPAGPRLAYAGDSSEIRVRLLPKAAPKAGRVEGNIGVTWQGGGLRIRCEAIIRTADLAAAPVAVPTGPAPRPGLLRRVFGRPRGRAGDASPTGEPLP